MKFKLLIALLMVFAIPHIASAKAYPVKIEGKPSNKVLKAFTEDVLSDIVFSKQLTIKFKLTVFKCDGVWASSCRTGDTIEIAGSIRDLDTFRWVLLNELTKKR